MFKYYMGVHYVFYIDHKVTTKRIVNEMYLIKSKPINLTIFETRHTYL